ncbi:MAG: GDSL-type esterase/lipase family protein [Bacteroidota bacterium]|nr:GDSL-type esterase/lipase family protein [Bacteroidota bacterium]
MKRILIFFVLLSLSTMMSAQNNKDWAKLGRYAEDNAKITKSPKAVLYGDSITDGWPKHDEAFFKEHDFVGRGIGGQTTEEMLVRFRQDVINLKPKYVVILAGINDVALNNGYISNETTVGNIISMCELAKLHKIKPIICSLTPADSFRWRKEVTDVVEQVRNINTMLQEYARKNHIPYVNYFDAMKDENDALKKDLGYESVHPNLEGYKVMESVLLKTLK